MMEAIRRLFRKRHKPIPKMVTRPHKSQRTKKPVPVETPEDAEVRRRMAEKERKRDHEMFFEHFTGSPKKPATQEATNLERAKRIIIASARYTEKDEKERLKEVRRRILADVRREAKEKEIG